MLDVVVGCLYLDPCESPSLSQCPLGRCDIEDDEVAASSPQEAFTRKSTTDDELLDRVVDAQLKGVSAIEA